VQWASGTQSLLQLASPTHVCVLADPVSCAQQRAREGQAWLVEQLSDCTDLAIYCSDGPSPPGGSTILLEVQDQPLAFPQGAIHPAEHVAHEAYRLGIAPEQQQGDQLQGSVFHPARCHVTATTPHGLFNGCQSLLQVRLAGWSALGVVLHVRNHS
jgi:hypothetical protein